MLEVLAAVIVLPIAAFFAFLPFLIWFAIICLAVYVIFKFFWVIFKVALCVLLFWILWIGSLTVLLS